MMTLKEIRTEISRIPSAKRSEALSRFNITTSGLTTIEVIDCLASAVQARATDDSQVSIYLTQIRALHGVVQPADPAVSAQASATAEVAGRAKSVALDALNKVAQINSKLINVEINTNHALAETTRLLAKVTDRLDRAETEIGAVSLDELAIQSAVSKVVADAFAPFKHAVELAGAQSAVADLATVFVTETKSALDAFGVDVRDSKGNPVMVRMWNDLSAPAIDPFFVWTEKVLRHFVLADLTDGNVWLGGEKGTGKSESARQFCARTGRAFKRINFHKYTTCEDYCGATGLVSGETVFVKGDFLQAFTHPSTLVLLDEVTNADAGELATLNGFLEPNSCVSYGGAVHTRANGVLVFAADNTLGNGDETGRYAGTRQMNTALVDRFSQVVRMDYLNINDEVTAVTRHTGCSKDLATHVLKAVHTARAKVQTADIVDAPSIRSVCAFIRALKVLPVIDAWDTTIANRQPSESATALDAIRTACIDPKFIADNI